jgi:squalene-hopene/tetraprenyl-beta-curcumene cyclase
LVEQRTENPRVGSSILPLAISDKSLVAMIEKKRDGHLSGGWLSADRISLVPSVYAPTDVRDFATERQSCCLWCLEPRRSVVRILDIAQWPTRPMTLSAKIAVILACAAPCLHSSAVSAQASASSIATNSWNARSAATYLDSREAWWLDWPTAARDHETACVSCHTALPYALARPALREALAERDAAAPERRLVENVVKRVQLWHDVEPFYPDQTRGLPKTSESRGTEAILNALILARRDMRAGALSDDARQAFANLWQLQFRAGDQKGAWAWLNFHNEPWEANGSPYFGAALAAIAVGSAPGAYASTPEIQDRLTLLRSYFQRSVDTVSVFNRVMALWASAELPALGLLSPAQRQSVVDTLFDKQRADGGWSMSTLGTWTRGDGTAQDSSSDGYATGLVALALQRATSGEAASTANGTPVSRTDPRIRRALDWLMKHQDPATGAWSASSLNRKRDPATDVGKFMSDAATAYAVLALTAPR